MRNRVMSICLVLLAALAPTTSLVAEDSRAEFVWLGPSPRTLDPAEATGLVEKQVIECLYEGLTRLDAKTLRPVPAAAGGWIISRDGRRYTFTIRREARWSNGDRVVAGQFVAAWKRLLSPSFGSEWVDLFGPIRHAEAFARYAAEIERLKVDPKSAGKVEAMQAKLDRARAHLGVDEGFWAKDSRTLVVELERFAPYFLRLLAQPPFFPVHPHAGPGPPPAWNPNGPPPPAWRRFKSVVGNGPYVLRHFDGEVLRLEKSKSYWDAASVAFGVVEARTSHDHAALLRRYAAGEGDWFPSPPRAADTHDDAYREASFITYFYRLNTTRPHLKDPRVRQALSLAIDRQKLCKEVLKSRAAPAPTLVPPGVPSYKSPQRATKSFDVARAKSLMKAAGYEDSDGDGRLDEFPPLRLLFNTSESHAAIAKFVAKQLARNLGIEARPYNLEWQVYQASRKALDYDIARGGWIGDYLDPKTFLDMLRTGDSNSNTGWSDALYDELVAHADDPAALAGDADRCAALCQKADKGARLRELLDEVRAVGVERSPLAALRVLRLHLLREAEAILASEVPILPLYYYSGGGLVRRTVGGFHPNVLHYHPIRDLRRR